MSVYDRGYMNDSEESANYSGRHYTAVAILIILNVAVWVFWQFARNKPELQEFMDVNFTVSADGVLNHFRFHTLVTAAFSHIEIMHILWNMVFLYYLGTDVEMIYGYRNMYVVYLFCAVVSSMGQVVFDVVGGNPFESALGASGANMGIAVIAAIFDPNKPMYIFGLLRVPLKWVVIFYIAMDISGLNNGGGEIGSGSLIAHSVHLAGAVAGFLYWKMDLRLFPSPGRAHVGWFRWLQSLFRSRPKLRIIEKDPGQEPMVTARTARAQSAESARNSNIDLATSQRVDELLSKISRQGLGALTNEERAFLEASSQKYKKR